MKCFADGSVLQDRVERLRIGAIDVHSHCVRAVDQTFFNRAVDEFGLGCVDELIDGRRLLEIRRRNTHQLADGRGDRFDGVPHGYQRATFMVADF